MATFMLTLVATGLGTFAANLALLWLIGAQANKLEKQRIKDMVEQQKELMKIEAVQTAVTAIRFLELLK